MLNSIIPGYQHEPFEVWMQCDVSEPEKRFCVGKVMLGPRPSQGYDSTVTKPEVIIGDKFVGYFRPLENQYEYTLDINAGFIRLNFTVTDNIQIGVVYKNASEQYFGKGWQESQATDTLILKLIKVDNQIPSIAPLAWQLKMKNFYKLPYTNIQRESSIFLTYNINGVYYHNIPGYSDFLVTMLKLDRYQNDTYTPPPDKVFDWLPSITIFPQYGEIMFPILEPFCGGLKDAGVSSQYWFCEIYSNDKLQTQSNPKANMYKLRGNLLHN
jgi:cell surface protein SprA